MIQQITMYTVECDKCGYSLPQEYFDTSKAETIDTARYFGWVIGRNGNATCGDCVIDAKLAKTVGK